MAQGSTKKSSNKKMAYTHHNDAMTSAHNTIQHLWCISHGIVMMSVSHFLVSRHFGNVFTSSLCMSCVPFCLVMSACKNNE